MGKNKNKKKNSETPAAEAPVEDTKEDEEMIEKTEQEAPTNEGVQLLEEVFGSKASVSSTGVSDDSTSNNSSTEAVKEPAKEQAPKD